MILLRMDKTIEHNSANGVFCKPTVYCARRLQTFAKGVQEEQPKTIFHWFYKRFG